MDVFDGDWVEHPEFGTGVVVRSNGDTEVRVLFNIGYPRRRDVLATDLIVVD